MAAHATLLERDVHPGQIFPSGKEPIKLPMKGILAPSESNFAEQMADHGFEFDISLEGRLVGGITWPTQEEDFKAIDPIFDLLNNPHLSDEDFRKHVRNVDPYSFSIERCLDSSPLFSRLYNPHLLPIGSATSKEHILSVLEKLKTDHLPPIFRIMLRNFTFHHDTGGKAINPTHPSHGLGSSLISEGYYRWANAKAGQEIYSPDFIADIAYLCRTHHLFAQLWVMLRESLLERRAAGESLELQNLDLDDPVAITDYLTRNFEFEVDRGGIVDSRKFNLLFQPYLENPALIMLAGVFVEADVSAGQYYAMFEEFNLITTLIMISQVTRGNFNLH